MSNVGSGAWADDVANGNYPAGSNKCNLFVYDALTAAGASPGTPNGWINAYPPTAGQWADPNYAIPGWKVLGDGETPEPGDVVAQRIRYSDASGHVMIVGPDNHFIGTGPDGTIENIPFRNYLGPPDKVLSPLVFRRWGQ
jgi:hypothetical protein